MEFNNIYSEEFTKLLQDCYNDNSKLILKNILNDYNSKKFYIIDMIKCYRIYYSIFTYDQPYKQECKLFIDNYGNTYGFGWYLWEKKYLYIFNLYSYKLIYYNNNKNLNWYDIELRIKDIKSNTILNEN